jgi:hypothetical protein
MRKAKPERNGMPAKKKVTRDEKDSRVRGPARRKGSKDYRCGYEEPEFEDQ